MQKIQQAVECLQRQEFQMALKNIQQMEQKNKKLNQKDQQLVHCIKAICFCKLLEIKNANQQFDKFIEENQDGEFSKNTDLMRWLNMIVIDLNRIKDLRQIAKFLQDEDALQLAIYDYDFAAANQIALKLYKDKSQSKYFILSIYLSYFSAKAEKNLEKQQKQLNLTLLFLNKYTKETNDFDLQNVKKLKIDIFILMKKYKEIFDELNNIDQPICKFKYNLVKIEILQNIYQNETYLKDLYFQQCLDFIKNQHQTTELNFDVIKKFIPLVSENLNNELQESLQQQLEILQNNINDKKHQIKNIIHTKLMLNQQLKINQQSNIQYYIKYFSDQLTFFEEILPYIDEYQDEIIQCFSDLKEKGIKMFIIQVNFTKIKLYFNQFQKDKLLESLWNQYLQYYNELDQDVKIEKGQRAWSDEYIIIIFDVFYPINEHMIDLIYILEHALSVSPFNFDLSLRLYLLYIKMGLFEKAYSILNGLDIKSVQFETLSFIYLKPALENNYILNQNFLSLVFQFYSEAKRESKESLMYTNKHNAFYKMQQFIDYDQHLQKSYNLQLYQYLAKIDINIQSDLTWNLDNYVIQPQTIINKQINHLHDYLGVFNNKYILQLNYLNSKYQQQLEKIINDQQVDNQFLTEQFQQFNQIYEKTQYEDISDQFVLRKPYQISNKNQLKIDIEKQKKILNSFMKLKQVIININTKQFENIDCSIDIDCLKEVSYKNFEQIETILKAFNSTKSQLNKLKKNKQFQDQYKQVISLFQSLKQNTLSFIQEIKIENKNQEIQQYLKNVINYQRIQESIQFEYNQLNNVINYDQKLYLKKIENIQI